MSDVKLTELSAFQKLGILNFCEYDTHLNARLYGLDISGIQKNLNSKNGLFTSYVYQLSYS